MNLRYTLRIVLVLLVMQAAAVAARAAESAATTGAETAQDAKLALASIFSDHMVLQREIKAPVWGTASPGAEVTVQLGEEKKSTAADEKGQWQLTVGPLEPGKPLEMTVSSGDQTISLKDVLVGDVWIASGQSNMEWPVGAALNPDAEIATADWPEIRIIDVPNVPSDEPKQSFESAGWQPCKPETIKSFSAVAYYFGRHLHKELHVPIGLIGCNWGGTPMEAWTSREALESSETFRPIVEAAAAPPKDDAEADQRRKLAMHQPAALFNGMLSPVIPYAIRGAIWYQGESNASRHAQYAELSKLMVSDWRNRWGQGDFPFLLVQLAAFEPGGDNWPPLREAQLQTLELPKTGMAVAIDIGDKTDIHPRNKQEVGRRLALAALAIAHGKDLVYSGPIYRKMAVDDGAVRLSFDHIGGGLKADGELKGFEIAGPDGKWVPAKAAIDGAQVVVSADGVADPKAVRYSWSAYPDGNLFNAEGLPASPFRTGEVEAPAEPAEAPAASSEKPEAAPTNPRN